MPFDQAMLDQVVKKARRKPLFEPTASVREVAIGRSEIERLLPHRDPMLLVDRISGIDLGSETMRAHRRIDPGDPLLRGHFPGYPVYPGALLVETMGQASLCLHLLCASAGPRCARRPAEPAAPAARAPRAVPGGGVARGRSRATEQAAAPR